MINIDLMSMSDSAAAVASSAATTVHREGDTYGDVLECEITDAAEDAETTDTAVEEGETTDTALRNERQRYRHIRGNGRGNRHR